MAFSYLFQSYRIWKLKASRDVSLPMLLIIMAGAAVWFIYGYTIANWPLMIVNGLTIVNILFTIILLLKYRTKA